MSITKILLCSYNSLLICTKCPVTVNINIIYIYYTGISHNCIYYYYTYNSHIKKTHFPDAYQKKFFYSIVLVHASSVRTRDWTRTCSWILNWTRTEPIDKVRVRFEFKYHGFGFGSSSGIIGSGSVRVRKTARWAGSSSGSSSRFNELEPDRTEPRNTNCII